MRKLKSKWNEKQWGILLQPHRTSTNVLTNLRFADDILLLATSMTHLREMIADLSTEARKTGLLLHPDKTKILHNGNHANNRTRRRIPNNVQILDMTIDILPAHSSTKYLGKSLSFNDPHRTEIENRISYAWKKFHGLKQELTGHRYSLSDRLRLFHGTVTPTILYGCEAWTMTMDLENRLKRTQRQMLRMILHAPRRRNTPQNQQHDSNNATPLTTTPRQHTGLDTTDSDNDHDVSSTASTPPRVHAHETEGDDEATELEPWTDWIQRCTHDVETRMKRLKLDDWITLQRRRKWRWARKVAMTEENNWMVLALQWDPTLDNQLSSGRRQGRPKTRWLDDIKQHVTT